MGGRPGPYDRMGGYGGGGYGGYPGAGGYGMGYGRGRGYGGGMGSGMRGGGMSGRAGGLPGQHIVHMRGLPFRVSEQDIMEWFSAVADAVDVSICFGEDGRPSGEADVMFASHEEAQSAMTKNKQNMQHRYIELFYDGTAGGMGY